MKRELYEQARQKALEMYEKAHIVLTPREKEILSLLCKGLNYQEIANTLVISQFTVRKHIQNIYAKLNVSDRVNALIRGKELLFQQDL